MLDQAGMRLDAGGIAKGYAADAALSILAQLGIRSALVAASGDLAFGDPPPGQRGWRIGVDSFDRPEAAFTHVLELSNAAVSTSGDQEQHLDIDGARYSHIIDPTTGMGLKRPITVTVVARHGTDADGLATAVSVLGPERGISFIEKQAGVAALVVTDRVVESSRWPARN
jgi:thiamine biosynthesis lipoprotein